MKPVFQSTDGRLFDTQEECEVYENLGEFMPAVRMEPTDIEALLAGENRELGDVVERLARKIAAKRLEMGGSKRVRGATALLAKVPAHKKSAVADFIRVNGLDENNVAHVKQALEAQELPF
jgi:hypothetical protein